MPAHWLVSYVAKISEGEGKMEDIYMSGKKPKSCF